MSSDRVITRTTLVVLMALCALAAHQATYVLGVKSGRDAPGSSTHDSYWLPMVMIVMLATAGVATVALRELHRLARATRHLSGPGHPDQELTAYLATTAGLWARLGLANLVLYTAQENIEYAIGGAPMPGLDALGSHGWLPLVVVLASSLAVAAVAALVRWRCDALLRRTRVTAEDVHRPASRRCRPPKALALAGRIGFAGYGSRGPPALGSQTR